MDFNALINMHPDATWKDGVICGSCIPPFTWLYASTRWFRISSVNSMQISEGIRLVNHDEVLTSLCTPDEHIIYVHVLVIATKHCHIISVCMPFRVQNMTVFVSLRDDMPCGKLPGFAIASSLCLGAQCFTFFCGHWALSGSFFCFSFQSRPCFFFVHLKVQKIGNCKVIDAVVAFFSGFTRMQLGPQKG